jgi:hypothetical protein
MTKKILAVLVTAVALLGASLVAAQPASASYSQCADDQFCLFDGADGGGSPIAVYSAAAWAGSGICQNVAASANDRANSAFNRFHVSGIFTHTVTIYPAAGCVSPESAGLCGNIYAITINAQQSWSNNSGCTLANRTSSIRFN